MISYVLGNSIDRKHIYSAFALGFSDYVIKFTMDEETFFARFFGCEGNQYEHSVVAFDDEMPVGVLLGGIRNFDGAKTMRCGALAVAPEYRGKGISNEMMKLHKEQAMATGCQYLMLEVIAGNQRAINFYLKEDYKITYDIRYYSITVEALNLELKSGHTTNLSEISLNCLQEEISNIELPHTNWQNDMNYIPYVSNLVILGDFDAAGKIRGFVIGDKNGKIYRLWCRKHMVQENNLGNLLSGFAQKCQAETVSISFTNDWKIQTLVEKYNFMPLGFYQHEMAVQI